MNELMRKYSCKIIFKNISSNKTVTTVHYNTITNFLVLFSLDASEEDESLGRLVNDNHKNPNCVMKKIIVDNKPHLCLFATKKIEIGSEIEYSYGDAKWPWRRKVSWLV